MAVMMPRQNWTDERLDHFGKRVDERFDRVDERFDRVDERFATFKKEVDERFSYFESEVKLRFEQVDERLDRIEGETKEIRIAIKDLHEDNKATLRVMMQGIITLSGSIVAGCAVVAGANVF